MAQRKEQSKKVIQTKISRPSTKCSAGPRLAGQEHALPALQLPSCRPSRRPGAKTLSLVSPSAPLQPPFSCFSPSFSAPIQKTDCKLQSLLLSAFPLTDPKSLSPRDQRDLLILWRGIPRDTSRLWDLQQISWHQAAGSVSVANVQVVRSLPCPRARASQPAPLPQIIFILGIYTCRETNKSRSSSFHCPPGPFSARKKLCGTSSWVWD